ncbi:pterin-4a-carbinolamine dehydratase, putative [Plasmodium ovale]|uniref:4a-hydroxytetrahydrobiopterin dehydratase n=1 Tax=Plasmodium ovale TaxID=36330 RepID=A0A1D3THK3_PLAOA|nr:pterin-4a-carbinolamine dehydratase, putative [Plasmodium ovale]
MMLFCREKVSSLLPLWRYKVKSNCYYYIERKVRFPTFSQAWKFMNEIFEQNELINHHCKYTNDYTKVKIKMFTHTAKGVTEKDITLATIIDKTLQKYDHEVIGNT